MKSNSDSDELIPNFKSSFKFEELVNQFYENDSISIPLLAEKMAISVSTLERLVKTKYGITPKQFITDIKLSKAEVLIRQGNKNIKQIASEIGFNSVAYFSTASFTVRAITCLDSLSTAMARRPSMQAHSVGMHVCRNEALQATLLEVMGNRVENVYLQE
jgi:AraC-like DNA-binding protein